MEYLSDHELALLSVAWQRGWNSACHRFLMDHDASPRIVDEVRESWADFDPYKQELDRRQAEVEMSLVERNAEVAVGN